MNFVGRLLYGLDKKMIETRASHKIAVEFYLFELQFI